MQTNLSKNECLIILCMCNMVFFLVKFMDYSYFSHILCSTCLCVIKSLNLKRITVLLSLKSFHEEAKSLKMKMYSEILT